MTDDRRALGPLVVETSSTGGSGTTRAARWLLLASLIVVGATACGGGGGGSVETTTFSVPANAVRPIPGRPPRGITSGVIRIALRSSVVRQLEGKARPSVAAVGDWTSIDDGSHLGGIAVLRLAAPVSVDADLPYVSIPPDSAEAVYCEHPYAQGWLHEQSRRVTELRVLVDVQKKQVVSVQTNATRGTRSKVPGKPYPGCS